jgi:hypothetical protein
MKFSGATAAGKGAHEWRGSTEIGGTPSPVTSPCQAVPLPHTLIDLPDSETPSSSSEVK